MPNKFFLLLIGVMLLVGCITEDANIPTLSTTSNNIIGKWRVENVFNSQFSIPKSFEIKEELNALILVKDLSMFNPESFTISYDSINSVFFVKEYVVEDGNAYDISITYLNDCLSLYALIEGKYLKIADYRKLN